MERRTAKLLVGGLIVIVALIVLFGFIKNRSDWRSTDYPGSGTNWIGINWNKLVS